MRLFAPWALFLRPAGLGALALVAAVGTSAAAMGCEGPPQYAIDPTSTEDFVAMKGFSWVVESEVAGMPRPGSARGLDEDLAFLRSQGVDLLVSLTEKPIDPDALTALGIAAMHIPVVDFHAPTQTQLDQYVLAVDLWTSAGFQVGTHCGAGKGRTGTFLAALFVARGMSGDAAIAEVRRLRPGSIETQAQEQAVRDFAARRQGSR
jgi:atypical dual specificity phosphatase